MFNYSGIDKEKIWFTSDLHFCHDREFLYKPRGFNNVEEMNNAIVERWNNVVGNNDFVFVLGDLMLDGVRHVVLENLDNGFGKSYVKDETLYGINFNDIVKFLGISSLKQEVEHIGRKYGIAVSTVQSNYTSKMCPVCGCIEDENRPNQETFCCVECGHRDNADHNAAVNIKNRVGATVLRQRLLKQLDNGTYKPLKLTKDKIKSVLLSYRANNLKVVENL